MTGNNLNDRDTTILHRIDIFGGVVTGIYASSFPSLTGEAGSPRSYSVSLRINDVSIAIYGIDTAEAFAAALAEGIDEARRLMESTEV